MSQESSLSPERYRQIISQFHEKKISYLLLRYPHLLPRSLTDLDILVETQDDYRKAKNFLIHEGFIEIDQEHYRTFLAKKEGNTLLVIDLYKEVSWLGWIVLKKDQLFQRKRVVEPTIIVPSNEDELLIYLAQALFKNHGLNEYKTELMHLLLKKKLDYKYILAQTSENRWNAGYNLLITKLQDRNLSTINVSYLEVLSSLLRSSICVPRFFQLIGRTIRYGIRHIAPYKRTTTICFIGVDGVGKSTIIKEIEQRSPLFFEKFNLKTKKEYFGWRPFLPTTKLISGMMKKKDYKIVESLNEQNKASSATKKVSFKTNLVLLYTFIDYLAKYLAVIGIKRAKRRLLFVDRWFYDMYVHYQGARHSGFFKHLLNIYPRPDYIFLLKAPLEVLESRKKEMSTQQLQDHLQAYTHLAHLLDIPTIDTTKSIDEVCDEILSVVWKDVAKGYAAR